MCELVECCTEIEASIISESPTVGVAPTTPAPTPTLTATPTPTPTSDQKDTTPVDTGAVEEEGALLMMGVAAAVALLVIAVVTFLCMQRSQKAQMIKDVESTRRAPVVI
jgi:hypothetical protein